MNRAEFSAPSRSCLFSNKKWIDSTHVLNEYQLLLRVVLVNSFSVLGILLFALYTGEPVVGRPLCSVFGCAFRFPFGGTDFCGTVLFFQC